MLDAADGIFKIKNRKNKWGIYQWIRETEVEELVPCRFDSVGWFIDYEPFILVRNKRKYGLLLNPYEVDDAADKVDFQYDEVITKERDGTYYAVVRKGESWGLIDWFEGFTIVDFIYTMPDAVPLLTVESWELPVLEGARQQLQADLVIFDRGNGDGVIKVRNKVNQKWGMYQSEDGKDFFELIPAEYDSLRFFPFNGSFTAVYNGGKVGFFLSRWSHFEDHAGETIPCIYDDHQRFTVGSKSYLAVKQGEMWGWVDWLSGEVKSEFVYATKEDLPYPDW